MPVPWLQIVRLMPSILEVSRELLKRTRKLPAELPAPEAGSSDVLETRVRALEENERRQAELLTSVAEQLSQLTTAASALHKLTRWLILAVIVTALIAIAALVMALRA